ncbi:tRNA uridine(34) 5-carboxymethylaminomethyl modification radical SAM/GNAT enzyme Elp3 [Patescibacteria group bacterium AH-259-L05]|nr:tRNA uridine(34) 5-carboxymethylaminomethyl modification radical SAM/GNAT enzyme Elp3 [Patescibacteria group bacterium AH-259-L05]
MTEVFVQKILQESPQTFEELQKLKRQVAKETKTTMPSQRDLLSSYRALLKSGEIRPSRTLEQILVLRSVRTISGVAPITVLVKPYPCPAKCVYCPTEKNMPKSYLANEPAAARALRNNFDPYRQVMTRLRTLYENGHPVDKLELIVKGGTWGSYPWPYDLWFITRCFEAANDFPNENNHTEKDPSLLREGYLKEFLQKAEQRLLQTQGKNEKAQCRFIGITLETRPDWIDLEKIRRMRLLGTTRLEIGFQHSDDKIQKLTLREHTLQDTKVAAKLLRDAGFKVDFHTMPHLPGSTPKKDFKMYKTLFKDSGLRPDMIKIYPCVVIKSAELYQWWKQGKYMPYKDKDLVEMLIKVKSEVIPPYVRISRLIRDFSSNDIVAGNKVTNLREVIQGKMRKRGLQCECLRCREIGHSVKQSNKDVQTALRSKPQLFEYKYSASGGKEFFVSFESKDKSVVFAFLRMRFPSKDNKEIITLFPELQGAAFIRELHTYGHLVSLGKIGDISSAQAQHQGLGKKLMARAEKIAKNAGYTKMAVISGIGVREYYQKLGYKKQGTYMVKSL